VAPEGLTEIGYTSGGSHGSTYVDRYLMRDILAERLGKKVVERAENLEPGSLMGIQDEWERAKRHFDPEKKRPIHLPFSYRFSRLLDEDARRKLAQAQNGVSDEIVLSPADVTQLFDYAIDPILALVDKQLQRIGKPSVGTILLVGGFAQSAYLEARLRKHVGNRTKVVVPGRPSMAVLVGTVHYGLEPEKILGRRSRFTYGVSIAMPFEDGVDPVSYRLVDADGGTRCDNRFDIFVRADEIVPQDRQVRRAYFPLFKDQNKISLKIYTTTEREPRYTTDNSCEQLGELTLDISGTLGKARSEREVEMCLTFGGTEIEARAVDQLTHKEVATTVNFERKV
jgi:hypothetical protein